MTTRDDTRAPQTRKPAAESAASVDRARARLERWRAEPEVFAREALGFRMWSKQEEVARAVVTHSTVAVASGHKTGKSVLAAVLAIWYYALHRRARVILTAPTYRQVDEVIWYEVRNLLRGARVPIGGLLHETPSGGLRSPDGREIFGFSTDDPDKFSGLSGGHVLYIADEAAGIAEPIFEALRGARMSGARLLMMGNPTSTSGSFYDAFHANAGNAATFRVSSLDTPNAIAGRKVVEGLAMREECESAAIEWGADSDAYRTRVEGLFPRQGSDGLIGPELIDVARARGRTIALNEEVLRQRLEVGVDVARFGDDESVITMRRGFYRYPQIVLSKLDTQAVASAVANATRDASTYLDSTPGARLPRIKVDAIGVGAGVADALRAMVRGGARFVVTDVNSSETAKLDPERFALVRDELAFATRDWLRDGGTLPDDEKLAEELKAMRYRFDVRGRYRLASKDDVKKVLGRSPDRADSLALSVYDPPESHDVSRPMWIADL